MKESAPKQKAVKIHALNVELDSRPSRFAPATCQAALFKNASFVLNPSPIRILNKKPHNGPTLATYVSRKWGCSGKIPNRFVTQPNLAAFGGHADSNPCGNVAASAYEQERLVCESFVIVSEASCDQTIYYAEIV